MFPPTNKGLSVKFKAFSHTFNIPRRKYICKDSFSLTTCSHLRWSLRPSLPANLPPALCPSVHRLLRRDLCGWPMEPRGPLSLAQRWPREEAQRREERASSRWTKGECNVLAPHESSQAHREHIRTSGFYLRFLFFFFFLLPQRVDWASSLSGATGPPRIQSKRDSCMHSPNSRCRVPYPRFATEALR